MFLETHVGDCFNVWVPAEHLPCAQVHCLVSSLPSPPLLCPQSPSFRCVHNDCLTSIMILTARVLSTDDLVWPHGGCRPSLVHIRVMGAAWTQKALPLACLVCAFQQSWPCLSFQEIQLVTFPVSKRRLLMDYQVCSSQWKEGRGNPWPTSIESEGQTKITEDDRGGRRLPSRWKSWYSCMKCR